MDSLTQIVLGGAVGEAVLGKRVGNKAVLFGAIGGTIPDLDTIPGQFIDTVSRLEIHRGFSHSIVFAILVAPLLGLLLSKLYKKNEASWWGWTQLFFWSIFTHPLLDIFTTWGTQLLWPLDWRIAIQSIFVIDPIYTIPFLICLISVLFFKRSHPKRIIINKFGIIISSTYLLTTVLIKLYVNQVFIKYLEDKEIRYARFDSRPTPFNTFLWTSNIETEKSFLISYYSLLDNECEPSLLEIQKNEHLLQPFRNNIKVERLLFLTKGYYSIEKTPTGIAMNDLRFGLRNGFSEENKREFVFTYYIDTSHNGLNITQKKQSFKGAKDVLSNLWERINGIDCP